MSKRSKVKKLVLLRKLIAWVTLIIIIVGLCGLVSWIRDYDERQKHLVSVKPTQEGKPTQEQSELHGVTERCDVWVLNVDNGLCCVLVSTSEDGSQEAVIFDGGDYDQESVLDAFLKKQNIGLVGSPIGVKEKPVPLNAIIVSHFDSDHVAGINKLLESMSYKLLGCKVFVPDYEVPAEESQYTKNHLLELCLNRHVQKVVSPDTGLNFSFGSSRIRFMNIYDEYTEENDFSLCIKLTHGTDTLFIGGDVCDLGEANMLSYWKDELKADAAVANHHGSSSSNSLEFFQTMHPASVIISCGDGSNPNKRYGHPSKKAIDTFTAIGANLYRTDKQDTIHFYSEGNGWKFDQTPTTDWSVGIR